MDGGLCVCVLPDILLICQNTHKYALTNVLDTSAESSCGGGVRPERLSYKGSMGSRARVGVQGGAGAPRSGEVGPGVPAARERLWGSALDEGLTTGCRSGCGCTAGCSAHSPHLGDAVECEDGDEPVQGPLHFALAAAALPVQDAANSMAAPWG